MTDTLPVTNAPIHASGLRQLRLEDPSIRIVDVRTGGEFESAHIPGSHNIPLDKVCEHVGELAALDHPVVLVCQSGARASNAREQLAGAGKDSVRVLDGGMVAWEAAGGDVARGETERWAMDRQVRLVAGSITLAGIAASTVVPKAKWVAGFIGSGLTFSALSNTCAMGTALSKLPYNQSNECDVSEVIAAINNEVR